MDEGEPRRRQIAWRPVVRALHRDLGYLAVGLTFVYAVSGLAVNHISQWDPNYTSYRATRQLRRTVPREPAAAAAAVLGELGIRAAAPRAYLAAPDQLEIVLNDRRLHVNPQTGRVVEEGQRPRWLLRTVNWLHLNRGKRAWTVVADLYAVGLLLLAGTGLFMLPARKGLLGRGGVLVAVGVAIPVLYVVLSKGP